MLPASAAARRGIQAAVVLTANGAPVAQVRVNQPVRLQAVIDRPDGAGVVDEIAWNTSGTGGFVVDAQKSGAGSPERTVRYDKPGTYFPALRVTTGPAGDGLLQDSGVEAIGRMRVIVRP